MTLEEAEPVTLKIFQAEAGGVGWVCCYFSYFFIFFCGLFVITWWYRCVFSFAFGKRLCGCLLFVRLFEVSFRKVEKSGLGNCLELLPVISSRAGGRKFQKEKETIGRSDVWLFFCTTPARASLERHFSEWTNSTNQAGISTSHYFFLEMYSSQHFSLGISTSEYFSLEISSEEETHPKLTLFS